MNTMIRVLTSRNTLSIAFLIAAVGTIVALEPTAELQRNWPQWRGPNADGVAVGNPPVEWSPTKNIKWKVELPGKGSGSPIVWNDRVFVVTAIPTDRVPAANDVAVDTVSGDGNGGGGRFGAQPAPENLYQFVVICLDRATGKQRWMQIANEAVPHEGGHNTNTFASGSPITDGKLLYAFFGSFGVHCYDLDGNLQWQKDLGDMRTRNGFGEGGSPALHGDVLIVPWDHEDQSFIAALHAKTGELMWRVDRDEPTTWSTPLIVEHGGRTQVVTNGTVRVRSYDLQSGELLWQCGGQATNPIPSPVVQDNLVYCMTGYRGYAVYALPLDAKGDITDSDKIAWKYTEAGPYVSSPVLYKKQLYFTKSRDAVLFALNATSGKVVINEKRLPKAQSFYASPVAAADRIYLTSREGTTVVLQHGETMNVLATNEIGEPVDASPAIVDNELFLRGEQNLYCITNE